MSELLRTIDPMAIGLALAVLGATFWYFPRSSKWRVVEQNNLRSAENLRASGQLEDADKVEGMCANVRKRLPIYGISFMVAGAALLIWGALR